jgi:catechol 2,3-dioxygenase-like lactoylglutathione lyase family enzyme
LAVIRGNGEFLLAMLANQPIIAFIPTRDAARARLFYQHTLGLRFVSDDDFAIVMDANGTMLRIVRAGDFTPLPFTILGWQVPNLERAVADLTAKGVQFQRYGFLDQSPSGIWSTPTGDKVAWFADPDGNTLSLTQFAAL